MELDNRIVGEQNTLTLLTYLHRFGWLTSRMLTALVWPNDKQSTAMSRRATKALVEKTRFAAGLAERRRLLHAVSRRGPISQ